MIYFSEIVKRVNGKWALVSKKSGRVLAYYKGSGKPSDAWIRKQERRVQYFKHRATESLEPQGTTQMPILSEEILNILTESPFRDDAIPSVYCDLDGVLANFYGGMEKYLNVTPENVDKFLTSPNGWNTIEKKEPHIFAKLPILPDAKGLMRGLTSLRDNGKIYLFILTAIPDQWHITPMRRIATQDKVQWVTKHFPNIPTKNILVVRREQKQDYAATHTMSGDPPAVLIDDYGKNIKEWENVGGLGIKHTSSSASLMALHTYLE